MIYEINGCNQFCRSDLKTNFRDILHTIRRADNTTTGDAAEKDSGTKSATDEEAMSAEDEAVLRAQQVKIYTRAYNIIYDRWI